MISKVGTVPVEDAREVGSSFAELAVRTKSFLNQPVHVHAIVSPVSGFFRNPTQVQEVLAWLRMIVLDTAAATEPNPESKITVHVARYKGHPRILAGEIIESLILKESFTSEPPLHLLLSLGGDGTHQEVLSALMDAPRPVLEKIIVFRLPLGTGNDGADVVDLASAAKLLLEGCCVTAIKGVRVHPTQREPLYAFNIVSVGIDAFVTHMANQLKHKFDSDIYKKIADVSVLFYPLLYPAKPMELRITLENGSVEQVSGKYVLTAFGVSGHRSYGNHKWILPGEENLCAVANRSLPQKLRLKNLLYEGKHVEQKGVILRRAEKVQIHYDSPIFLQYDGESIRMEPENFPCLLERVSTGIQALGSYDTNP